MPHSMQLLQFWNLRPARPRPEIQLAGSPERCRHRLVVEDSSGGLWVLESIHKKQVARREHIGVLLDNLAARLAFVNPYRRTNEGGFVLLHKETAWQLAAYLPHEGLPRPAYLHSKGHGISLACCLKELSTASRELHIIPEEADFDLPAYISALLHGLKQQQPQIATRAENAASALQPLLHAWPTLPRGFCHGDCHPLNALWRQGRVAALIDWEFCGLRPRLYDLATCLGCVGIEDPAALGEDFAKGFIEEVRKDFLQGADASLLPELLLGVRFGWLAEWLRHKDGPLIDLELDFMEILAQRMDGLRRLWRLPGGE